MLSTQTMLNRLRIIFISLASGSVGVLMICLGSQNFTSKQSLNLGFNKSVPLPIGFIVGTSVAIGITCGGCAAAMLIDNKDQ